MLVPSNRVLSACLLGASVVCLGLAGCGSDTGKGSDTSGGPGPQDSQDTASSSCGPIEEVDVSGCLEIIEADPDGDARWPDLTRIQYDGDGRELSRDFRGGDAPNTELVCRTTWDGALLTEERCGGASIYRYAYTYDSAGHPVSQVYDAGDDGSVDRRWVYVTDGDGNVIEATSDDDDDGTANAMQAFAWDADGRLIEETWDYTLDGAIDYRRTLVWADGNFGMGTASEDGLLMEQLEDSDGDGTDDRHTVWTYDELDRPTEQQRFDNGSSTPAETTRWTYAGCALDLATTTDAGGNRTEVAWVFYDNGRTQYQIEDWDADGSPDRMWATTWQCPGE